LDFNNLIGLFDVFFLG